MNYAALKSEVIKNKNIELVSGYYRFVSHKQKIMTTGFEAKKNLLKYKDNIRFDSNTVKLMHDRYNKNCNIIIKQKVGRR